MNTASNAVQLFKIHPFSDLFSEFYLGQSHCRPKTGALVLFKVYKSKGFVTCKNLISKIKFTIESTTI